MAKRSIFSIQRVYRYLTWPCFIDYNTGPKILLSGSGRSGTTWLEEVISSAGRYRVVFEPFHMSRGLVRSDPEPWQYVDPEDPSPSIYANLDRLFNGKYRIRWTDAWNTGRFVAYEGRLVKAIRAHGCLKYIRNRFPAVKQVYIMRHPLGALSSYIPRNWPVKTQDFVRQKSLREGLLRPHLDFIGSVKGEAGQIMLRWCLENLVALSQLEESDALVVFYEHMVHRPEVELQRLSRFLGLEFPPDIHQRLTKPAIHSKGRMENASPLERLSAWKRKLAANAIDEASVVLNHFGFDRLYSLEPFPRLDDPQSAIQLF